MHDTTTPSLATHPPLWRRRLLATALIIAAGTALGVSATALTSDGGRRGDPPAGDAKDHPNYGPVDTTTTWTGDAKDHPNYGPVDTTTTWTGDAKDHPNYGPVDTDHHLDRRRQRPPQLRPRSTGESLPRYRRILPPAAHPGDRSSHRCRRRQRDGSRSRTGTFVGERRSTSSGSVVPAGRISPHPWRPVAAHGAGADGGECRTTRPNDSTIGPSSAPERHRRVPPCGVLAHSDDLTAAAVPTVRREEAPGPGWRCRGESTDQRVPLLRVWAGKEAVRRYCAGDRRIQCWPMATGQQTSVWSRRGSARGLGQTCRSPLGDGRAERAIGLVEVGEGAVVDEDGNGYVGQDLEVCFHRSRRSERRR